MKFVTIVLLLIPFLVNGQNKVYREYYEKEELCSYTMKLFTDSTYVYETGCEGRSNVNFGAWNVRAGVIQLIPIDTSNVNNLVSVVAHSANQIDTSLSLQIIDRYGLPIRHFDLLIIPKTNESLWNSTSGKYKSSNNSEIEVRPIHTDINGYAKCSCNTESDIVLSDLKQLYSGIDEIDCSSLNSDNILIKLDIDREVFTYPEINWINLPSNAIAKDSKALTFLSNNSNDN